MKRAVSLSLRNEKDVWVCGCFGLTKKHCGQDGGYKRIFGSGTRLLVRPGKWGVRERLRIKCLCVSRDHCEMEDELEFFGITITRVLISGDYTYIHSAVVSLW